MTPNLAVVRVETGHWWGIPIPIPLFLLWIPAILLAPFVLLALWIACLVTDVSFLRTVSVLWSLLCSLPGTDVRVVADGNRVTVRIV